MLQFDTKTVFELLSNLSKQVKYAIYIRAELASYQWKLVNYFQDEILQNRSQWFRRTVERRRVTHCAATTKDRVRTESYR